LDREIIYYTMVFIKEMNDFPKINEIYGQYFTKEHPADPV